MTMRSPKSWLMSFTYGVSPQPEHAPEYSKSGSSAWEPLSDPVFTVVRSTSGSERK